MLLRPVVRDGRPGLLGRVYGMSMATGSALPDQAPPVPPPRPSSVAQPPQPAAPSADRAALLAQLAELHARGVLTDAELAAATARLPAS